MEIPVLLEPLEDGRYRARAGEPFGITVEAASRNEALLQLDQAIKKRLASGAELVPLYISRQGTTHRESAETLDQAFYDELMEAIAENRRQEDAANP